LAFARKNGIHEKQAVFDMKVFAARRKESKANQTSADAFDQIRQLKFFPSEILEM